LGTQETYGCKGVGTNGGDSTSVVGDQSGRGGGAGGKRQDSVRGDQNNAGGEGGIGLHKITIGGVNYVFKDLIQTNVGEYLANSTINRTIGTVQDYIDNYDECNTSGIEITCEEGNYFSERGGGGTGNSDNITYGGLGGGGTSRNSTDTKQPGINGSGGGGTGADKSNPYSGGNKGSDGGSVIVIVRYKTTKTSITQVGSYGFLKYNDDNEWKVSDIVKISLNFFNNSGEFDYEKISDPGSAGSLVYDDATGWHIQPELICYVGNIVREENDPDPGFGVVVQEELKLVGLKIKNAEWGKLYISTNPLGKPQFTTDISNGAGSGYMVHH